MLTRYIALVSQCRTLGVGSLMQVAGAIQKQLLRDAGPSWGLQGLVSAYPSVDTVPPGYWTVLLVDEVAGEAGPEPALAPGLQMDENGQPWAVVSGGDGWPLAASRACLELLLDPWGCQTIAGWHPQQPHKRVEFLLEACSPCQDACFAYAVNGVLLADFVCPAYFGPVSTPGARYSWTGAIRGPGHVLPWGHLSWLDPECNHWFQLQRQHVTESVIDLGPSPRGVAIRSWLARGLPQRVPETSDGQRRLAVHHADAAMARAEWLRQRIELRKRPRTGPAVQDERGQRA